MLSGPQIMPFFCATADAAAPPTATTPATNASGLSTPAIDAQCNIATEHKLYYRTTTRRLLVRPARPDARRSTFTATTPPQPATPPANACFKPYTPARRAAPTWRRRPPTPALTVPYIVRVERGTMNRGIYDIAVLFDPTQPWTRRRAAGAVERQDPLPVRRLRPASRAASRARTRTGPTTGAVARLHGGAEQHDRLGAQLEPRDRWPRR